MTEDDNEPAPSPSEGSTPKAPKGLLRRLLAGLRGGDEPLGPPAHLGRYRLLHRLGQGGMGIVFAAEDESLGRSVALKTIAEADESARRRFQREARAAAGVNHPNVCQVYEIGEDGGRLFIAMELLEGESLAERLKRGPLSVPEGASSPRECSVRCRPCTMRARSTAISSPRTPSSRRMTSSCSTSASPARYPAT